MCDMKDSGIEWIGDIPRNWEVSKIKNLFYRVKEKAKQENPTILSLARLGVKVRNMSNNDGQIAESYFDYNPVLVGDFLINPMDLYSGANCNVSYVEGVISPAYINLRSYENCYSRFYDYYMKTQYWGMTLFAHGKGVSFDNRWTLNNETLMNYYVPSPPLPIQKCIADYLDQKCAEINAVIEKTKATIEEYKKYKYAVVADAATKGINKSEMSNSDIDWLGQIPKHWKIIKVKYLFSVTKRIANSLDYDVLSVTQNGLKIKDLSNNEGQVASDYSKYQIVEPNDFVMNHMDLLTGWVDCSTYSGVTSPDYRVFILDRTDICNRKYYTYIFQLCYKYKIFYGLGQGVSNLGRWRLQTDKFINFELPVPPYKEQQQIADYLEHKCAEIDTLIAKKQNIVAELEGYKKSLIYECVTGKREVATPQISNTVVLAPLIFIDEARRLKAQTALMAKALDTGHTKKKFGKTEWFKTLYLLDACVGFPLQSAYIRGKYGPILATNTDCANIIFRQNKWFIQINQTPTKYVPTKNKDNYISEYESFFSSVSNEIEEMLKKLNPLSMNEVEKIATLYAVWNDFILDGKKYSDNDIVNDVLSNWSNRKRNFSRENWHTTLEQMRKLDIVPKGYGMHTIRR